MVKRDTVFLRRFWPADPHACVSGVTRRSTLLGGLAAAALPLLSSKASALRLETGTLPFPAAPERDGVLSWRELERLARRGPASGLDFDPEIRAVQDQIVKVQGFMLPVGDAPLQTAFLIAAYRAHCAFCIPGGMLSLMEVSAARPVPAGVGLVALQGRLQLLDGGEDGLLFRLGEAVSLT